MKRRHEQSEREIKEVKEVISENNKELYKVFVTKDDHHRDINAIERKIDGIKDILMDIKEDIGRLTGGCK